MVNLTGVAYILYIEEHSGIFPIDNSEGEATLQVLWVSCRQFQYLEETGYKYHWFK